MSFQSLTELLEKERLHGVCEDCGSVLDGQGCACEPEWEFEKCFCPLPDSDLWVMIEHYARVHSPGKIA